MFDEILSSYGLHPNHYKITPFGAGLINRTWKLSTQQGPCFILQEINTTVFKQPADIADNIRNLGDYLQQHAPGYLFAGALPTQSGSDLYIDKNNRFFRLFKFIPDSHSIDVVQSPKEAYEAARQFALFTKLLSGFDCGRLKITIPQFHDLSLRYRQFTEALATGNSRRIKESADLIQFLKEQEHLVHTFEAIKKDAGFRTRVIHHDTKISNVLFDNHDKGLCVIDLDTVMPGYYISDVGDMMRTYLSPASEEVKELDTISVREEIFTAIARGYLGELKNELTETEKLHFVYSGKYMIYMQALRFLTDHLNDDRYYGAKYEGHNFMRAQNQAVLLQKFTQQEDLFNHIISTL
jgi:Putative homoserine kinase type II (protein kinase fold)